MSEVRRTIFPRRGQAALEYLVTYGWAFMVILAAIGVLAYFGLLNPSKYIPTTCEFGEQLKCVDYVLDDDGGMTIRFRNNFETDINISNATGDCIDGIVLLAPMAIDQGDIGRVRLTTTRPLYPEEKERFAVTLQFHRVGGTVVHNITGQLFVAVIDATLI